jgi:hypothetical protein
MSWASQSEVERVLAGTVYILELELHLNNDIINEKDLFDEEVAEQEFQHEIRLKHSPLTEESFVRD